MTWRLEFFFFWRQPSHRPGDRESARKIDRQNIPTGTALGDQKNGLPERLRKTVRMPGNSGKFFNS